MSQSIAFYREYLKSYYEKIFPSNLFFKWLSHDSNEIFSRREFSFTLKDDIYVRYRSFDNEAEFVQELITTNPHKIDIGAVYNIPPRLNKKVCSNTMTPEWKELVFDIDMTDYDDVRFCCKKADICKKCWTLMTVAIKVLNRSLREDFGIRHILWVYSGRRGIHCWVSDKNFRELESSARSAMVSYLSLIKGDKKKKLSLQYDKKWRNNLHPMITSSLDIIKPYFDKYFNEDQKILAIESGINRVLDMLPDKTSENIDYLKSWKSMVDNDEAQSSERWKDLVQTMEEEGLGMVIGEIMLESMYPRLDENVSRGVNHLLKSPFSVHPSTGKICVPIDFDSIDDFDPMTVPDVNQVVDEIRTTKSVKKTSLGKYIKTFEDFTSSFLQNIDYGSGLDDY